MLLQPQLASSQWVEVKRAAAGLLLPRKTSCASRCSAADSALSTPKAKQMESRSRTLRNAVYSPSEAPDTPRYTLNLKAMA